MSFNILLIQLVLFSCVFSLLRSPRLPKGWLIVSGLILSVLGLTLVVRPELAGWISGALWTMLVFIPLMGFLQVNRLVYQERYRPARRWAICLRWLHPVDGWWEYPVLLQGLELGQQNRIEEAVQILSRYGTPETATGRMAMAWQYRLEARWNELLAWIRQNWTEESIFQDVTIATNYLRSLGETGDLNGLLQGLQRFERQFEKMGDSVSLNWCRMLALAFCGQTDAVRHLFQGPLAVYSRDARQFWLATAELAAGREQAARDTLRTLQTHCDPATQHAVAWRLAQPRIHLQQKLTPASQQILHNIKETIQHEAFYSGRGTIARQKPYCTYGLIGINLLVFGLELWLGGSENLETLYRMGALVPENVLAGEWWRLVSAIFLHFGFIHLFVNLVALYVLGIFVESILGIKKFLLIYGFSGIGSMAAITAQAVLLRIPGLVGVGASGAIMGLLGAMTAILLKGWRQEKAKIAARRLRLLLFIVGLQVMSDLLTPQVSLVGHVSGLILGFLAASVLFRGNHMKRLNRKLF